MSTPSPNAATSGLAEEAAAALCLLSMKTASSSPQSSAIPSDYISGGGSQNTNQLLPMPLFTSGDSDLLSPLQCYIRKTMLEFFVADDNECYVAKGRQTPITSGRVGIRCLYCKHATNRATQNSSFPKQIDKIYSAASMIQCRHFPICAHIPKDVRDKLTRLKKQGNGSVNMQKYWAESARELGFVDTDADIRFSAASPMAMEDVESTTSNSVEIHGGGGGSSTINEINQHSLTTPARPRIVTPVYFSTASHMSSPLVRMDDKGLVQDHVFLAFAQMEPTILTTADKAGPWKGKMCGEKGLQCRHCQGRCLTKGKSHGKWYPSSAKNLGQTTTMNSIIKHTSNCPNTPTEVKNALASLLRTSCNDSTEVKAKKKYGSRKQFFVRVFDRMTAVHEPHSSFQSRVPAFSPIVVQTDGADDDSYDLNTVTAGSKRSRVISASDAAARKRAIL